MIIEVKNVSKKFRIHQEKSYSFKKDILRALRRRSRQYEEFEVLKKISFRAEKGEMLGIIGRNGSGKSTLLKLLARILRPTEGEIEVQGSISTLLELGAGFQPDFSGRENIYLNGSILGLSNRKIDKKLEEIISFAELEKFIDTPLRNYSSGMCLRLGFAIAVNVNPDILLIDEVLSVGDESFQKKSLNKILEFRRKGKTIVFVSHDLHTIERICDRAILLEEGELRAQGEPREVIEEYHLLVREYDYQRKATRAKKERVSRQKGTREVEITNLSFLDKEGNKKREFVSGEPLISRIEFKVREEIEDVSFGIALYDDRGNEYFGTNTRRENYDPGKIKGEGAIEFHIQGLVLPPGEFQVSVAAHSKDEGTVYHWLERFHSLKITKPEKDEEAGVRCEFRMEK
jgi:ABC-type polysaccharide/polyol phosphate transport system ATPase subunit